MNYDDWLNENYTSSITKKHFHNNIKNIKCKQRMDGVQMYELYSGRVAKT